MVVCHEGTRSNGGDRCCEWETGSQKGRKGIVEFSTSAEVDVSTSPSASTDDDESILETEQLEF